MLKKTENLVQGRSLMASGNSRSHEAPAQAAPAGLARRASAPAGRQAASAARPRLLGAGQASGPAARGNLAQTEKEGRSGHLPLAKTHGPASFRYHVRLFP